MVWYGSPLSAFHMPRASIGKYSLTKARSLKTFATEVRPPSLLATYPMPTPKPSHRLSASQRKEAIARAVLPVVARKGFDGVTTRELAAVSGVSEALIFRHYPTKEQLCAEIYDYCSHSFELDYGRIAELPPTTESLVKLVYFLIRGIVVKRPDHADASMRLLYRSLLEDGLYAGRVFGGRQLGQMRRQFCALLAGARATGDAVEVESVDKDLFWFCHHTASLVCLVRLAERPAVTYSARADALVTELTQFVLRGIGLSEATLREHATRERFAEWLKSPELTLLATL